MRAHPGVLMALERSQWTPGTENLEGGFAASENGVRSATSPLRARFATSTDGDGIYYLGCLFGRAGVRTASMNSGARNDTTRTVYDFSSGRRLQRS